MKTRLLFVVFMIFSGFTLLMAQKSNQGNVAVRSGNYKIVIPYLGNSSFSGGLIPKTAFDSLLRQGITARDSAGNSFPVNGFTFSYGERNLYEDSVGNLMVLTDFFSEYCPGDSVNPGISKFIYQKTKPGDTAYIENIKVLDGAREISAKSNMRFVLTK